MTAAFGTTIRSSAAPTNGAQDLDAEALAACSG